MRIETVGLSLSWIAVKGRSRTDVFDDLGVSATSETETFAESNPVATQVGDWLLIVASRRCDFADRLPLDELSNDCEIVTCCVEEHAMTSGASCWRNGRELWQVFHD